MNKNKVFFNGEGIKIDVTDNGIIIVVQMFKPTKDEVKAFDYPSRIQVKEGMVCGLIFFAVKAGDLDWMDAPYNPLLSIHLSEDGKRRIITAIEEGRGLPVTVGLYGASGLYAFRECVTTHKFAMTFWEDVEKMINAGEGINRHFAVIEYIYGTTTIEQLVGLLNRNYCDLKPAGTASLRKSQYGIIGIRKKEYPGLPEELEEYYFYYPDCGHSIMAIPEILLPEAEKSGNLDSYEVPFPVKYVLEKGYRKHKGFLICDGEYSHEMGLMVPEEYDEW